MVTVVVILDGEIDLDNDVTVKVSEDGKELVIKEKMIDRVENIDNLHVHFRKKDISAYPAYHPKIMGFQKYMNGLKREGPHIYNTASIRLPFPVQTDILDEYRLGYKGGSRLLYVDLRAERKEDSLKGEQKSMQMID